ncbi:MAG: DUF1573 domain-containing protein [Bacteroidota bacterium]
MKNLIVCLSFLLACGSLQAQQISSASPVATKVVYKAEAINVDKMEHDFGDIPQGTPVTAEFELTNNSNKPLIIHSAKGSCGCTATYHDKAPIPAGGQTTIKATYNAKKMGAFHKRVTVMTNLSDDPIVLKINGSVQKAE